MSTIEKQTLEENIDRMTDGILKAVESSQPNGWHEFDVFSGRMVYHQQTLLQARKIAVKMFLTELISKME